MASSLFAYNRSRIGSARTLKIELDTTFEAQQKIRFNGLDKFTYIENFLLFLGQKIRILDLTVKAKFKSNRKRVLYTTFVR